MSAQEIGIIDFGDLEVVAPPMKRVRTKTSNRFSKIKTSSTGNSSNDSRLQKRSKSSAAEPPETVNGKTKMREEAMKTSGDTPESPEADLRTLFYSSVDDQLSCELPPGYIKPSMDIDDESYF